MGKINLRPWLTIPGADWIFFPENPVRSAMPNTWILINLFRNVSYLCVSYLINRYLLVIKTPCFERRYMIKASYYYFSGFIATTVMLSSMRLLFLRTKSSCTIRLNASFWTSCFRGRPFPRLPRAPYAALQPSLNEKITRMSCHCYRATTVLYRPHGHHRSRATWREHGADFRRWKRRLLIDIRAGLFWRSCAAQDATRDLQTCQDLNDHPTYLRVAIFFWHRGRGSGMREWPTSRVVAV